MTLKKICFKCKSFDVAYLQLGIKLHWSWAFLNQVFEILSFLNNFCKIAYFQKGGDWSPNPPLAAPVGGRVTSH